MTTRRSTATTVTAGSPASATTQLELPLVGTTSSTGTGAARRQRSPRAPAGRRGTGPRVRTSGVRGPHHSPGPRPDVGDGSRLDEQTRRIGRQGIAAARALLDAAEVDGDRTQAGDDGGATGCAA